MHNFSTTGYANDSVMASNMGIIETGFNNIVYRHWVGASGLEDMQAGSTPSYFLGLAGTYPAYWRLQNAATTGVGFYVTRSPEWRNGSFSVVVHYAVSVAGDDIQWRVRVTPIVNMAAPSSTVVSSVQNAPSTTNVFTSVELAVASLSNSSQINASHVGVMVEVGRGGLSDSNTGDAYLYGIELVYKETKHVVGDRK